MDLGRGRVIRKGEVSPGVIISSNVAPAGRVNDGSGIIIKRHNDLTSTDINR